jgi:hypothetical protein
MGRWVIALVAGGVVLVAAAARAQTEQVVLAPTVYASHNLPSDAITGFTVSCPPGYLAASGGVSSPGAGATLLGIRPVGLSGFTFRFGNTVTNAATRATVAVACRKISGGPVLKLKRVRTRVVVKPGTQKSGSLACPPNSIPAGAAVDLDPARAKSVDSFSGGALSLRATTATVQSFRFRITNTGERAHNTVVAGNCATVGLAPQMNHARLSTTITTYTDAVTPGRHHFRHRCRRGWVSLGTGYTLTSGSLQLEGTAAIGTGGRAWVENTADTPLAVRLQVVCARVG